MIHPLPNPDDGAATRERSAGDPPAPRERPPLTLLPSAEDEREALIRTLALDRLRDLHYDGVTFDYMGRMYGVSRDTLEALEADLRRERRRSPDEESRFG